MFITETKVNPIKQQPPLKRIEISCKRRASESKLKQTWWWKKKAAGRVCPATKGIPVKGERRENQSGSTTPREMVPWAKRSGNSIRRARAGSGADGPRWRHLLKAALPGSHRICSSLSSSHASPVHVNRGTSESLPPIHGRKTHYLLAIIITACWVPSIWSINWSSGIFLHQSLMILSRMNQFTRV